MDTIMKLHEAIKNEVNKTSKLESLSKNSLANLILLSISQDKYFNDTYSYLQLSFSQDPSGLNQYHYTIKTPFLNNIKGSMHDMMRPKFNDVFEVFEDGLDSASFSKNEDNFFLNDNLSVLNSFMQILESNDNFKDFNKSLMNEQNKNKEFLHRINTIISETDHRENSLKNLLLVAFDLNSWENTKDFEVNDKLKSTLYFNSLENKKSCIDNNTIRDVLDESAFLDLAELNRFDLLKKIAISDFSRRELDLLLKDKQTNKVPDEINVLLYEKVSQKKIFNTFKKKYKNDTLYILLKTRNFEERKISFCEKQFDSLKNKSLSQYNEVYSKVQSTDVILNRYKHLIIPIREKIISRFPEFKESKFNFETIESKAHLFKYNTYPMFDIYINQPNNLKRTVFYLILYLF